MCAAAHHLPVVFPTLRSGGGASVVRRATNSSLSAWPPQCGHGCESHMHAAPEPGCVPVCTCRGHGQCCCVCVDALAGGELAWSVCFPAHSLLAQLLVQAQGCAINAHFAVMGAGRVRYRVGSLRWLPGASWDAQLGHMAGTPAGGSKLALRSPISLAFASLAHCSSHLLQRWNCDVSFRCTSQSPPGPGMAQFPTASPRSAAPPLRVCALTLQSPQPQATGNVLHILMSA